MIKNLSAEFQVDKHSNPIYYKNNIRFFSVQVISIICVYI
ncbi:hypothetical protein HMPREF1554_01795 [Porphyromonas gingivalis F0569]|nr:hypothetical protein A343_0712 [Porphyromonas gingivalis JCVI SC001]ERJ65198.1 hypothetical protein HMPREF1554_01795 [Porphyromonas gingivalis F0569]ERJ82415.1 hypothetical protein HMPREF1988_01578 [Porphyromonas gingivalis F0185]